MPTTLLNDRDIMCYVKAGAMIEPFVDHQVRFNTFGAKVISYGLSSFGYDVRLADEFRIFNSPSCDWIMDPHDPIPHIRPWTRMTANDIVISPNSMILGRTLEYIKMPVNGMAICLGKSTYARLGLIVNVTPLEPAWHGHITIELSNTTPQPLRVYANEGIAQLVFFTGERPTITYADRDGKYQGQTGVTLAKL